MSAFEERLWSLGFQRYHHEHPFHVLMHDGKLTAPQLQQWVLNRYYYQTRIPIKDALILSKSEDPVFRRMWARRVHEQDGDEQTAGGLALWRRLAQAVGIADSTLQAAPSLVLPGVQFACDAYVSLVREATLVEAVAASLTELFAPTLLSARIAAWERHYPWVDPDGLAYFRSRLSQASHDSREALDFVLSRAVSTEEQDRCVAALMRKTEILWHILDCLYATYVCRHCESRIPNERCEPSHVAA
ncbi:MAG TPA: pyrroloquinoline-quinone synthase PqqC [Nitrospira sp.]|nr:pyrroloquinoline-quinone synthase PqqC [Nitrospira sp.]